MNRRAVIKSLGLAFGYTVAAPSVLGMLESCKTGEQSWIPVFFDNREKHYVSHLVDIILPATDTPGGLVVNLPQFIDMMSQDMLRPDEKEIFKEGSLIFAKKFEEKFKKEIGLATREEIAQLFGNYFDLEADKESKILAGQNRNLSEIDTSEMEDHKMYYCLIHIRKLSLFGYFTSEKIGKEVLNFDPVPGRYEGCIPVTDIGNAWTI